MGADHFLGQVGVPLLVTEEIRQRVILMQLLECSNVPNARMFECSECLNVRNARMGDGSACTPWIGSTLHAFSILRFSFYICYGVLCVRKRSHAEGAENAEEEGR